MTCRIAFSALLALLALPPALSEEIDTTLPALHGTVTGVSGEAIEGARVDVSTAAPWRASLFG